MRVAICAQAVPYLCGVSLCVCVCVKTKPQRWLCVCEGGKEGGRESGGRGEELSWASVTLGHPGEHRQAVIHCQPSLHPPTRDDGLPLAAMSFLQPLPAPACQGRGRQAELGKRISPFFCTFIFVRV